jgi:hypothetical protein
MRAILNGIGDETVLNELRAALLAEPLLCGGYEGDDAKAMIERSTHYGDPYGWSANGAHALAMLSYEHGVPSRFGFGEYHRGLDEAWDRVTAKLDKVGGFVEDVNGGVALVWPA